MTQRATDGIRAATRGGLLLLAVLVAAGCAKVGPPGGGPVDSTPPTVLSTYPVEGQPSVPRDATLEFVFSESMDRGSVEKAVGLLPPVPLDRFDWSGRRLTVTTAAPLPDSTTVVLQLAGTARDHHGVAVAGPVSFAFSTGALVDLGVVAGTVTSAGSPVGGATVWACPPPVTPDSLGVVRACGYAASTDDAGGFRLEHVAASPTAYSLVAFVDDDGDGRYDTAEEDGGFLPDAALLASPGDSLGELNIAIVPALEDSVGTGEGKP